MSHGQTRPQVPPIFPVFSKFFPFSMLWNALMGRLVSRLMHVLAVFAYLLMLPRFGFTCPSLYHWPTLSNVSTVCMLVDSRSSLVFLVRRLYTPTGTHPFFRTPLCPYLRSGTYLRMVRTFVPFLRTGTHVYRGFLPTFNHRSRYVPTCSFFRAYGQLFSDLPYLRTGFLTLYARVYTPTYSFSYSDISSIFSG